MKRHRYVLGLLLLAVPAAAEPKATPTRPTSAAPARKTVWWGAHASYANESDLGVGARAQWGLARRDRLGVITTFDYFFPSGSSGAIATDASHWEVNGNLAYHFGRRWRPYVGPGLNVARRSAELSFLGQPAATTSETALGMNLLGGIRRTGDRPRARQYFAEARYEVKGGEQFLVSAGVLF